MDEAPATRDNYLDEKKLLLRALLQEANEAQLKNDRLRCEAAIRQIYLIADAIAKPDPECDQARSGKNHETGLP